MSEEIEGLRTTPEPAPEPTGTPVATRTKAADRRSTRNIVEWVGIVVGALILAVIVKTFLFQAFYIPSLSMYPTLHKGDRALEHHDVAG